MAKVKVKKVEAAQIVLTLDLTEALALRSFIENGPEDHVVDHQLLDPLDKALTEVGH